MEESPRVRDVTSGGESSSTPKEERGEESEEEGCGGKEEEGLVPLWWWTTWGDSLRLIYEQEKGQIRIEGDETIELMH